MRCFWHKLLEAYSFILKIHATFPHKGCHILGSGPNSIKHNLGIKATECRSFHCKTSTDQILKKNIFLAISINGVCCKTKCTYTDGCVLVHLGFLIFFFNP